MLKNKNDSKQVKLPRFPTDNCRISPELIILFKSLPLPCDEYKSLPIILAYCNLNYADFSKESHVAMLYTMYKHWLHTQSNLIQQSILINSSNAILRNHKFNKGFQRAKIILKQHPSHKLTCQKT